jgi:hypothetical protein
LTAAEVLRKTQSSLDEVQACRSVLYMSINTDLIKDSVSLYLWEQRPAALKVQVLSAVNPQLQGMAFATDGKQSTSYSPHANRVLVGPADRVKLPLILEKLLEARTEWIRQADPDDAMLVAKERKGGLVVYEVRVPLSASGYARYTVDARRWRVQRILYEDEHLGQGEIRVQEMDCSSEIGAADLRLDIPNGVPVQQVSIEDNRPLTLEDAQMTVPFPLRTPGDLPVEIHFVAAYQLDKNIAIVYGGEWAFTLVQGPGIGQVPQDRATPVPLRGRQAMAIADAEHEGWVLIWQEDGLQFSVAGTLERQNLVDIAESLELAFTHAAKRQGSGHVQEQGR